MQNKCVQSGCDVSDKCYKATMMEDKHTLSPPRARAFDEDHEPQGDGLHEV